MLPAALTAWVSPAPGATPALVSRPLPVLGPDDLLLEVQGAVLGEPELAAFARGSARAPGGAAVGRVIAAGAASTDQLDRRVLAPPLLACGECDTCRRGRLAACPTQVILGRDVDGALASHVITRRRWALPLDGTLAGVAEGPEAAALAREAALAYTLFARAGVGPGESTVWVGGGPIGRFGQAIADARSAHAVTLGAEEEALEGTALVEAVRARLAAESAPTAVFKVFETRGHEASRRQALTLATAGGTLLLATGAAIGTEESVTALPAAALAHDLALAAVSAPHPDLLAEVAALALRGDLDLAAAVEVRPFAELPALVAARAAAPLATRERDRLLVLAVR